MSYVCSTVINQSGFKVSRGKKTQHFAGEKCRQLKQSGVECRWCFFFFFPPISLRHVEVSECRTHFTFVLFIETVVVTSGATRRSLYVSWYIFIDTLPLFTFHILPAAPCSPSLYCQIHRPRSRARANPVFLLHLPLIGSSQCFFFSLSFFFFSFKSCGMQIHAARRWYAQSRQKTE